MKGWSIFVKEQKNERESVSEIKVLDIVLDLEIKENPPNCTLVSFWDLMIDGMTFSQGNT